MGINEAVYMDKVIQSVNFMDIWGDLSSLLCFLWL